MLTSRPKLPAKYRIPLGWVTMISITAWRRVSLGIQCWVFTSWRNRWRRLAEKHGRKNRYTVMPFGSVKLEFYCPEHGYHSVDSADPDGVALLEFNTPARNIVRSLAYSIDTHQNRATLQGRERVHSVWRDRTTREHTLSNFYGGNSSCYSLLSPPLLTPTPMTMKELTPVIAYAPLTLDWSGSKLSKSLYVSNGAYEYLKEAGMGTCFRLKRWRKWGGGSRCFLGRWSGGLVMGRSFLGVEGWVFAWGFWERAERWSGVIRVVWNNDVHTLFFRIFFQADIWPFV